MKIIYVYLGSKLPKYVLRNIDRNKNLFPEVENILIVDCNTIQKRASRKGIKVHLYKRDIQFENFIYESSHDKSFRNGFWIYSLERLLALLDYARTNPLESLVHLEADVLLMPNFPFKEIRHINDISWLKFNDSHDVAAIMYLPKNSKIELFQSLLLDEIRRNPNLTDMTLLARLSRKYPHHVSSLAIAPQKDQGWMSQKNFAKWTSLSTADAVVPGYFDSAPIGMWILGQDPRNHRGFLRKYVDLEESFIQPKQMDIKWSNHYYLSVHTSTGDMPLYNLHVHSKELKYFGKFWKRHLRKAVLQSKKQTFKNKFMPLIFTELALNKCLRMINKN